MDSNVLVYAIDAAAPEHAAALQALARLEAAGCEFWICPQVIRETLRVLLRGAELSERVSYDEVLAAVAAFIVRFQLADETAAVVTELQRLLVKHAPFAKHIHDTNLVALMSVHDIPTLLTNNRKDFAPFERWIGIEGL